MDFEALKDELRDLADSAAQAQDAVEDAAFQMDGEPEEQDPEKAAAALQRASTYLNGPKSISDIEAMLSEAKQDLGVGVV